MKLGSKKTKQAELFDALGGDVLASTGLAEDAPPAAPPAPEHLPTTQKASGRGSLPEVEEQRYAKLTFSIFLIHLSSLVSAVYILSSKNLFPFACSAMVVFNPWN